MGASTAKCRNAFRPRKNTRGLGHRCKRSEQDLVATQSRGFK